MKTMPETREDVAQILRDHAVTPTRQRLEIAYALYSRGEHLSADRILAIVNDGTFQASKATVYNTLNLFVEKKLVREVIVDPDRIFYDPNMSAHHHLYNLDTGDLTDIDESTLTVSGMPELPPGATVEGVDVVVRIRSH